MKTFRIIGLALVAILICLSACSGGGDDPIEPTPQPEIIKSEITIDSNILTNGLSFTSEKGEQSISFSTNESWTLSVASTTSGATWCTASATSGSKGTANVKFTVSENTDYDNRSVSVTIKSGTATKTFTISQKCADALLITTDKYEIAQEGGTIDIEVKANIEYKMEISEEAKDWITESSSRGLTPYKHTLKIAMNEDNKKREGEVVFKSGDKVETVKIYQAGGAILLLLQDEYHVSDKGDTISVDIRSNIDLGVQMPDVDWIVDEASSRGLSSHTLKYVVKANEGYDARSASIVFYDKNSELKDTLKVVQAHKDAIILSQKEITLSAIADTIDVTVSSNVEYVIEIPKINWINYIASRSLNKHNVTFYVQENENNERRQANIIFKNKSKLLSDMVTIIQKGKEESIPYLIFNCNELQSLSMSKYVKNLEFSVNGGEWTELGTATIGFGGKLGNLRLRGKNDYGTNGSTIQFGTTSSVSCSGDIRTLINYEKYSIVKTRYATFSSLFYNCKNLVSAPELPITDLSSFCYEQMFYGCTSLSKAPKLPAITLSARCYAQMFYGCISIVEAPKLPATSLAYGCYEKMFYQCTSLTQAPELPATILAEKCYDSMFLGCENLTVAPILPATTLMASCYFRMFYQCASLTQAPELPATILAEKCYDSMFLYCTNLTEASELPAAILAKSCYGGMFLGCTSLIKAPKLPAKILAEKCYEEMFRDCTNITEAPELPATTLAESCYSSMFIGCTNLTQAPELPATILVERCYSSMFMGCEKLNNITMLATDVSASYCLSRWMEDVAPIGTFTKAKEMESLSNGNSGIPNGWSIKNYGE